jgi:hypothetical protein
LILIGIVLGYIGFKKGDIKTGKLAMIVGVVFFVIWLIIAIASLSLIM